MPKEITDPIDIITYLFIEAKKDNEIYTYKEVMLIIKRARNLSSGVHYVKTAKTKWEEINVLWQQMKHTDRTLKEITERIADAVGISPHSVKRIVNEIRKNNKKI